MTCLTLLWLADPHCRTTKDKTSSAILRFSNVLAANKVLSAFEGDQEEADAKEQGLVVCVHPTDKCHLQWR